MIQKVSPPHSTNYLPNRKTQIPKAKAKKKSDEFAKILQKTIDKYK